MCTRCISFPLVCLPYILPFTETYKKIGVFDAAVSFPVVYCDCIYLATVDDVTTLVLIGEREKEGGGVEVLLGFLAITSFL